MNEGETTAQAVTANELHPLTRHEIVRIRGLYGHARYAHDCKACAYLGRCREFDLYACPSGSMGASLLARYGNDGPQYASTDLATKRRQLRDDTTGEEKARPLSVAYARLMALEFGRTCLRRLALYTLLFYLGDVVQQAPVDLKGAKTVGFTGTAFDDTPLDAARYADSLARHSIMYELRQLALQGRLPDPTCYFASTVEELTWALGVLNA